ncbi:dermonecrotic toxin domain-containing protein [Pseudomonas trivialis]|uniref:Dermonecrotic toxin N-terminal domain-containing protein n=1 Tax=Pseudomonas trivialis TaxID=200450 RepID=A0A0R2ZQC5_9PSED|nr:DUF6543 domain-containing protein [Pseudomonas trivialis]KRP62975.1 hypothetical protein TU79_00995 [Pseudomonas trivialis]SDS04997.1 hypothetical protein SAMN04490205_1299 [Pseudomonas trivialis]
MNDLVLTDNSELLTQLTTGPSLREVASSTLKAALHELYPNLDINPNLAIVRTPKWSVLEGELLPEKALEETLTGALTRSAMAQAPVTYLDNEHYLVNFSGSDAHLPVKIDAIGRLINELAPLLHVAFQEQQVDFWNQSAGTNGPRWRLLAKTLRDVWNVQEVDDWDADDCAVARLVYHYPDYAERLPHDKYATRTYLVDVDRQGHPNVQHAALLSTAVLIARDEQKTILLTYSINEGYKKFASLEAFGKTLTPYRDAIPDAELHWRLLEPDGNFFEYQACSLIGLQLEAMGDIDFSITHTPTTQNLNAQATEKVITASRINNIRSALPDWLLKASQTNQTAYARYMMDLGTLSVQNGGRTFIDELPSITDFARQALRTPLLRDHPEAAHLNLDEIEITVTSQVVWGTIAVPGATQTETFNLVELALQNLAELPLGDKTLSYRNASATPAWMTVAYLEQLITQADIGRHYPEQVNTRLLKDPAQSQRRRRLYTEQLRLQLPLLALQYKIRQTFDLDELGYRYVCAVMLEDAAQRRVDGYAVVIRPLALRPTRRLGNAADRVENMFIIGPQDPKKGPCLLYRPLADAPLMQFPSPTNLLYAIKQDTPLRQAVLAWLADDVRNDYTQFVFPGSVPSPWVLPELLSAPLSSWVMSGPVEFDTQPLDGDVFTALYEANARALVTLADRQSVSNAEARWESFKHAGWVLLNAALPFMGRTAGAAAWVWQLVDDLQQGIDAEESGETSKGLGAAVDFFLTLGMALALHVSEQHKPAVAREKASVPKAPLPDKLSIVQKPTLDIAHLTSTHAMSLHFSGALTRSRLSLAATLDSFSLTKPEGLGEPTTAPGAHLHLYPKGSTWYAPVAHRWFEVTLDENDTVLIIDPKNPDRLGPPLVNNRLGQWFIDTRLRLRGGGLRSRRQKGQRLRPPKIRELREQLDAFDTRLDQRRKQLVDLQEAIEKAAPADRAQARSTYLTNVTTRLEELDLPISQLKSLNILDTVPTYQQAMLGYLGDQIILARSATAEHMTHLEEDLLSASDYLDLENIPVSRTAREDCRRIDASTQALIDRISYLDAHLKDARALGADGVLFADQQASLLPRLSVDDLKAFRITLARFLCLNEGAAAEAHSTLSQMVDRADLAVQSLCEALQPNNPATLEEQIPLLDSLVEQFAGLDQSMADLPADFPQDVHRPALETLQQLTEQFSQRATRRLTSLLRERKALESMTAGPSKAAPQPRTRVIKTRFKGVVVGEERPSHSGEPATLVEVKQPLTGKVIALFHEKDGVWVERRRVSPQPARAAARDVAASIAGAQALLDDVDNFIERTKGLAGEARRLPVEIEERFHRKADELEQASRDIDSALTASNQTESASPSAALTNRTLDSAVKRLYAEGRRVKLDMLKLRPPTAAHVELLYREKEITINPLPGARSKLAGRHKGYLKEYEILDAQNANALWYAHFHYKDLISPEETYTAAHLKTKAQRRLGGKYQTPGRGDERDSIAVYRSEISPQLARSLFFNPPPPVGASVLAKNAKTRR